MFSRQSALSDHEKHHTGEKNFACSHCNKRFVDKRTMVRHERIHHRITGNDNRLDEEVRVKHYQCSSCDKSFDDRSNMKRHERMVHKIVSTEGGPLPKERKPRCGDCTGCQRADDCKECPACLDKPKYGGPGKVNRVCR